LKEAIDEIEKIKNQVPDDIFNASFEAALDGIEKSSMNYSKDIVLKKI
jgi:hypothetical protein